MNISIGTTSLKFKSICSLVGMVLIIFGLYSFLWGKRGEKQNLPQPNVAAGEVSTGMLAESTTLQSMVAPSTSPNNTDIHIEKIDTTQPEKAPEPKTHKFLGTI